jgi:hypothetical protein
MPNLAAILNDTATLTIDSSDGEIDITYYPSRVTQETSAKLIAVQKELEKVEDGQGVTHLLQEINAILANLIQMWNLEDIDPMGKVYTYPIHPEAMMRLPVWLISEIAKGLVSPKQTAPQRIATKRK